MLTAVTYKTKQFLLVLIKISLVVAAFYFMYSNLFKNSDLEFSAFILEWTNLNAFSASVLIILIAFSLANWLLEIFKWQTLVGSITDISFKTASKQTLGALTASLFTPNRIGEYGAKALYFPRNDKKKIVMLNLLGNSFQMAITIIFGIIGCLYVVNNFESGLNFTYFISMVVFGIMILIGLAAIMKLNYFQSQLKSITRMRKFLSKIERNIIVKTFLFSALRYLIFSSQFYYLLHVFGVRIDLIEGMLLIFSMYFIASVIPSIFILDVVVKGGVAVYLFGLMGISEIIILSIITTMWLLNFMLPSIIGSYHVLNFKLPKPRP